MRLSVIVPVYKEQDNIGPFLEQVKPVLTGLTSDWEIIFCLDPSPDQTEARVLEARTHDSRIKLLKFSRRFGQPMATLSGLEHSKGDAAIVMDVDLQDPPALITQMVAEWKAGFDVVYARRSSRRGETIIKRIVASVGYWVIAKISEVQIPRDTGDFRLLSRRVITEVLKLRETHGFLRGLVALVGYPQKAIIFERPERHAGQGNYNAFLGSLKIGINGIICFSNLPLRLNTILGAILIVAAIAWGFLGVELTGPQTLAVSAALAGLVLLGQGLQGAYIGRIYDDVRARPRALVDRAWGLDQ